jgi:chemotaxis protein methyltransferase CheR
VQGGGSECVRFLQWALPTLHLRWRGYRKVRKTVCKRIRRRVQALGIDDFDRYRHYLERHPDEWRQLDALCRIPISRFYRDKAVFEAVSRTLLPGLAAAAEGRAEKRVRVWSAGCASGEEPYTVAIAWRFTTKERFPDVALEIVATDADAKLLERAAEGCYAPGSLKDLPRRWREEAFAEGKTRFCVLDPYRRAVSFRRQDIREEAPEGPFDLVLCRNLAFTYFEESLQRRTLERLLARLRSGGHLVLGSHERLPDGDERFSRAFGPLPIFRRAS